jgi:hypothetical protein
MNWLDLLLIVILAISIATSFAKGITREIIGLVASVAALLCGVWFYRIAGAAVRPYVGSREVAKPDRVHFDCRGGDRARLNGQFGRSERCGRPSDFPGSIGCWAPDSA